MSETESLLEIANTSGFPLQLSVEHVINSAPSWELVAAEHHWEHAASEQDGYIDLIARSNVHRLVRLVIECKKAAGMPWVFFVPEPAGDNVRHASLLCFSEERGAPDTPFWAELLVTPSSYESGYSTIRGQHRNQRVTLEKISESLLRSVEGLASEESAVVNRRSLLYIPMIVTAADLKVCAFNAESVSLSSGSLCAEDVEFEDVSCVRFRKGLASSHRMPSIRQLRGDPTDVSTAQNIKEANLDKERTIFVVQAKALSGYLSEFNAEPAWSGPSQNTWPHLIWSRR